MGWVSIIEDIEKQYSGLVDFVSRPDPVTVDLDRATARSLIANCEQLLRIAQAASIPDIERGLEILATRQKANAATRRVSELQQQIAATGSDYAESEARVEKLASDLYNANCRIKRLEEQLNNYRRETKEAEQARIRRRLYRGIPKKIHKRPK